MSNHFVNLAQQNFQNLNPEQRQKLMRFVGTPQFKIAAGTLFGDEAGEFIGSLGSSGMHLLPVPEQAMTFLGEEKAMAPFLKAMEKKQLVEQEQLAAQPQGFAAAPQQAQQQAPVSPPAPTGLASQPQAQQPQLPLPRTSNALSVGNQPIV